MSRRCLAVLLVAMLASIATLAGCAAAPTRPAADLAGRTPAADVFQQCKDSVVNLGMRRKDDKDPKIVHTEYASGIVLHESGYILTNAHLLRRGGGDTGSAGFDRGKEFVFKAVAVDDARDIAVLKINAGKPLKPFALGVSRDLFVGETVIAMGNPYGMGLTVSQGIVSALGRSTESEFTYFPDMIQTGASTNPGNSGGPLLTVRGDLVGMNTTEKMGANNIAFAIPVDRIRDALPDVLDPEGRFGFVLGLQVAMDGPPRVTAVAKGSPAAAGLAVGDVITGMGTAKVASGLDFYLALMECRAEHSVPIRFERSGAAMELVVVPAKAEMRPSENPKGLVAGLRRDYYTGKWEKLPDFAGLKPAATEKADRFELGPYADKERFGLKFTGYVEVPADGVYTFYVRSDDGSQLHISNRLVVDNDGIHTTMEKRGFIPLKAGRHPITVTYFQNVRSADLKVSWEGPGLKRQPIPAAALFSAGATK